MESNPERYIVKMRNGTILDCNGHGYKSSKTARKAYNCAKRFAMRNNIKKDGQDSSSDKMEQ